MVIRQRLVLGIVLGLSLGLVVYFGCGDDDGGPTTVSGPCWSGECPSGWSVEGYGCVYNGPTTTLSGDLIEFGSDTGVEGARVQAYDNSVGVAIPVCADSGAGGAVSLSGIPADITAYKGKIGLKASKDAYKDTYQFGLALGAVDETLWIVTEILYAAAPTMAGLVVDSTKGVVAGAVYFINELDEEEEVGCATVNSDMGGDIRYFNDEGLPTTIANREDTNPSNGYFIAANVSVGSTEITASVDAVEVGSVSIYSFADSICINNIYVTGLTNPEPPDCE